MLTKSGASATPVRFSTGAASGDDGGIAKEEEEEGNNDGDSGIGIARVISCKDVPQGHVVLHCNLQYQLGLNPLYDYIHLRLFVSMGSSWSDQTRRKIIGGEMEMELVPARFVAVPPPLTDLDPCREAALGGMHSIPDLDEPDRNRQKPKEGKNTRLTHRREIQVPIREHVLNLVPAFSVPQGEVVPAVSNTISHVSRCLRLYPPHALCAHMLCADGLAITGEEGMGKTHCLISVAAYLRPHGSCATVYLDCGKPTTFLLV